MSSRIIISILLGLVGTLGACAAAIDLAKKNSEFQPSAKSAAATKAKVVKPAATLKWNRSNAWSGNAKVQKITPLPQSSATVEVSGFVFHHAQQATPATVPVVAQPAGGSR